MKNKKTDKTPREARREKILAKHLHDRLQQEKRGAQWGIPVQKLMDQWRALVKVAIFALLTAPLWPFAAILMCFSRGRAFIFRTLLKIQPVQPYVSMFRQKFLNYKNASLSREDQAKPIVFMRPVSAAVGSNDEQVRRILIQQLCPQNRALLEGYNLTKLASAPKHEATLFLSLSRAETSILGILTPSAYDPTSLESSPTCQ